MSQPIISFTTTEIIMIDTDNNDSMINFPPELIEPLFDHIKSDIDIGLISKLVRCSKGLYQEFIPYLYKKIALDKSNAEKFLYGTYITEEKVFKTFNSYEPNPPNPLISSSLNNSLDDSQISAKSWLGVKSLERKLRLFNQIKELELIDLEGIKSICSIITLYQSTSTLKSLNINSSTSLDNTIHLVLFSLVDTISFKATAINELSDLWKHTNPYMNRFFRTENFDEVSNTWQQIIYHSLKFGLSPYHLELESPFWSNNYNDSMTSTDNTPNINTSDNGDELEIDQRDLLILVGWLISTNNKVNRNTTNQINGINQWELKSISISNVVGYESLPNLCKFDKINFEEYNITYADPIDIQRKLGNKNKKRKIKFERWETRSISFINININININMNNQGEEEETENDNLIEERKYSLSLFLREFDRDRHKKENNDDGYYNDDDDYGICKCQPILNIYNSQNNMFKDENSKNKWLDDNIFCDDLKYDFKEKLMIRR
ncbi:uncharacterized protein L201_001501 [Kwoniella dendrophila CBS 6074]|uniref:F-box domain-containing protein n=1 Tax=Kwoniella dendrophila CBS 6074 TaxID=1295534 RepID=A0AAX4JML0_9TREE